MMKSPFKAWLLTLCLLLTNVCYGNETIQRLNKLTYTDAEAALSDIDALLSHNEPADKPWLYLQRAEAQGLLHLFDDMQASLQQLSSKQLTTVELKTKYQLLKGILKQNQGELNEAQTLLQNTIQLAKQHQLSRLALHARVELAYTHTLLDQYNLALKTNHQAQMQASEVGDTFIVALADDVYGAIYGYMDQYEQSINYYQKALKGYQSLGYKQYASSAVFGIATSSRYWGKLDQAVAYFQRFEAMLANTSNEGSKFYGRYGMATTLTETGDCNKALPALSKAINTPGPEDYRAELYKRQARCFININQLPQAEQALAQAQAIFATMPDLMGTTWQIETIDIAHLIAKAKGDYQTSLKLLSEYQQKQSTLSAKTYSEQLIATKANLESQQKDLEIKLLKENAKVQDLMTKSQERKNKQQRFFLFALSLVIIIILFFALVQYRNAQKIAALSIRDELTGLFNRRYIFNQLNEFLSKAAKDNQLSIFILDIDNFKQINDSYGHVAGDSIIKSVAQTSLDTLRLTDCIGRVGGEEFLCLLPRTTPKQSEDVAQRLLEAIRNKPHQLPSGETIAVTVSIGLCHQSQETDAKTLYHQADLALYQSKESGKDKLSIYQP